MIKNEMKKEKIMNVKSSLTKTIMWLSIITIVSKLLGFIRELVFANYYGVSYVVDAYVMAFSIPGILFAGILGCIGTVFIPTYCKVEQNQGLQEANKLTNNIVNFTMTIAVLVCIGGIVFSGPLLKIFAHGFDQKSFCLANSFLKLLFVTVIFSALTTILDSYLQTKNIFIPQALTSIIQNIFIILFVILSIRVNVYFLPFGIIAAYFLNAGLLSFIARRRGYFYRPCLNFDQNIKYVLVSALPVFVGSGVSQINMFVDKTLASGLVEGSVAALNYAMLLNVLVTSLTISLLVTVVYPRFSKFSSSGNMEEFNKLLNLGISSIGIVLIPTVLIILVYSREIVSLVYQRGVFDAKAVSMTSYALLFYSIGLIFYSLNDLLARVYYSLYDTKTPLICSSACVIINVTGSLILSRYLNHGGIALASSIAGIFNTCMLYVIIRVKFRKVKIHIDKVKTAKICLASIIAITVSYLAYKLILYINVDGHNSAIFLAGITMGGLMYLFFLYTLKINEFTMVLNILKNKLRKA